MSEQCIRSKEVNAGFSWWRPAKFGMFIHWGLYAIPAGIWKGQEIEGIGEWIMRRAHIPVAEYEKLAQQFNPVKFDAKAWVKVAKDAGMKYIVITAKHHDGFAMYDSKASQYDIVDATPFGRDPIKELAEACREEGIRLCFYYSQAQDWHEPNGAGNDWDFDETKKDFAQYFEEKVKPQVRELLTQYGPIGLIWFDTPVTITESQSRELTELVHQLQPDCLVNSRVGHGAGDYRSAGDNQIPVCVMREPWETPATLNDTWGFKTSDHNWKSVKTLVRLLVDIVSKGGNYLLNVGPTAEGEIPKASIERLQAVGKWLEVHGEAIYGTSPSPFPCEIEWGAITQKPGKLYLHVFDWPAGKLVLYGLKNRVKKAYLLGDKAQAPLPVSQERIEPLNVDILKVTLPATPYDENVSVIVVEIEGEFAEVDETLIESPSGNISLEACKAQIHRLCDTGVSVPGTTTGESFFKPVSLGPIGVIEGWVNNEDWLSWEFKVITPGTFDVEVWTSPGRRGIWEGGHKLKITVAGQQINCTIDDCKMVPSPRSPHQKFAVTECGHVSITEPGTYTLEVRPEQLISEKGLGLMLRSVNLIRAE